MVLARASLVARAAVGRVRRPVCAGRKSAVELCRPPTILRAAAFACLPYRTNQGRRCRAPFGIFRQAAGPASRCTQASRLLTWGTRDLFRRLLMRHSEGDAR